MVCYLCTFAREGHPTYLIRITPRLLVSLSYVIRYVLIKTIS